MKKLERILLLKSEKPAISIPIGKNMTDDIT
jgi:hypothetical protein